MNTLLKILLGAALASMVSYSIAQQKNPDMITGCVYNATPPTLTDKQTAPLSCDSTGKLRVTTSF